MIEQLNEIIKCASNVALLQNMISTNEILHIKDEKTPELLEFFENRLLELKIKFIEKWEK